MDLTLRHAPVRGRDKPDYWIGAPVMAIAIRSCGEPWQKPRVSRIALD